MKNKIVFALPLLLIGFVACKKNTDGNKAVISSQTQTSESYTYKGIDGTRAKATFDDNNGQKTLTVEANNNKFQLDLAEETKHGSIYQRNGVKAVVKGDSINLEQDNNIIPLVRDK